jgi:hypothetical protein
MLFNYFIWIVAHAAKADKAAVGTINRPLQIARKGGGQCQGLGI